jgi:glycosyltransferase involved in cell wall biosynthesis
MRIALLTTCHLEYVAQLANSLASCDEVSVHILDGINYLVPQRGRFPNREQIQLFRKEYETYLNGMVRLGYINPWPYKWDPRGLFGIWHLVRAVVKDRPDVLHVQEALDFRIFLVAMALRDIPLVLTVHDPRVRWGDKPRFYSKVELGLRAIIRKRAKRIIVHSQKLKEMLLGDLELSRKRVAVIPHGAYNIYWRWYNPDIGEDEGSVLFFGRLVPSKGLDCLIQAEPLITAKCPFAKFVIAGEGDEWERCKRFVVHPEKFVVQNHYVPNHNVAALFQQASIIVLPYKDASQSGVAVLAFAFGKPVVATRVGGIEELVDDGITGILVPPNDPEALADALTRLLTDTELRRKMGHNALSKAQRELSWDRVAEMTRHVYEEAISYP